MKVLAILAGGRGERLRPFTETRPKPLMPVLGESLLCRHLKQALASARFDVVVVLTSYMAGEVLREARSCAGDKVVGVDQGGELGTGHAILRVMEEVGPGDYTIVYGDLYLDPRYYKLLASAGSPAILASRAERPWEYGVLEVEDGILRGVREKPDPESTPSDALVFIGGLRLDYDATIGYLRKLKPSPRGELEVTDALNSMARDYEVRVLGAQWPWLDVGRPWDLLRANRLALEEPGFKPKLEGEVHPTAVVEGPVYIAPGARVRPHSVIEGPAYIGGGAEVGPNAHLRPYTVMLEGSKAGFSTQVKASLLMEHSKAPHLNYVGDSVVGEHVNLGAGTVTANLRFDGKTVKVTVKGVRVDSGLRKLGAFIGGHAKTGINVSIMPGVKIGSYAVIYPGCVVTRDVAPSETYKC